MLFQSVTKGENMKNFQKLMGGAVLALILTAAACQDTGPAVGTPADISPSGGDTSANDALQKQIDELKQQIEDLKNAKPGDPVAADAGVTVADLSGHWVATSDVSADVNGNMVDLIASQGLSYALLINDDGSYLFTASAKSGKSVDVLDGIVSIADGQTLVMDGKPEYTVSFPAAGMMKWVALPGSTRTIEWKKAVSKPVVNPIVDPVNPAI